MKTKTVIKCKSTLFCLFGQPLYVLSDGVTLFLFKKFKQFLRKGGIALNKSNLYHPTSNLECKKINQTVLKTVSLLLRAYRNRNLPENQYCPKPCTRFDPYFAWQHMLHRINAFSVSIDAAWLVAPFQLSSTTRTGVISTHCQK